VNTHPQTGRKLRSAERAIIAALAPTAAAGLGDALVVDMRDGGMGSIRFLNGGDRRRSRSIAEAEYVDVDGVLVSIELNIDQTNHLFELDFWKVDSSPLLRYPDPTDLKSLK
jgi:hypothetical protein